MITRIVQIAAGTAVVGAGLWLLFVVSFRTKFAPVQDAIRRMNRRVVNPRQLRTAGRPGASASVVHHVGRTTGGHYRTPVVPVEVEDGLLVALPYGPGADWVRNVLAAGSAEVEHEGVTIRVHQPELVPFAEGNPRFPAKDQRTHRRYGVEEFLLLRRATEATSSPTAGA